MSPLSQKNNNTQLRWRGPKKTFSKKTFSLLHFEVNQLRRDGSKHKKDFWSVFKNVLDNSPFFPSTVIVTDRCTWYCVTCHLPVKLSSKPCIL